MPRESTVWTNDLFVQLSEHIGEGCAFRGCGEPKAQGRNPYSLCPKHKASASNALRQQRKSYYRKLASLDPDRFVKCQYDKNDHCGTAEYLMRFQAVSDDHYRQSVYGRGKSSSGEWEQSSVYIRNEVKLLAQIELIPLDMDLSALVDGLLCDWLKSRGVELVNVEIGAFYFCDTCAAELRQEAATLGGHLTDKSGIKHRIIESRRGFWVNDTEGAPQPADEFCERQNAIQVLMETFGGTYAQS